MSLQRVKVVNRTSFVFTLPKVSIVAGWIIRSCRTRVRYKISILKTFAHFRRERVISLQSSIIMKYKENTSSMFYLFSRLHRLLDLCLPSPPVAQAGPPCHYEHSEGKNQYTPKICYHGPFSDFIEHLTADGNTD
jgi:hypothetical protein